MKLSIVIPVYLVESTLNRCVESVLAQDVEDMEVILVDDGSPDNCPKMCDEWGRKDNRIKVIHKENGGLSEARNTGIDIASGDFITFVDSDDWISPNTYAPLLELIGDSDLLEYAIANRLELQDRCYNDIREYWLKEKAYTHTYACNKIYRRSLFDGIRYPKGKIFEDVYTLPKLLRKARKVMTTSKGFYHYEWNPKGITATADGLGLSQLLNAHLVSGMPMDDMFYMFLVNIQMDVWELSGTPLTLPERKVDTRNLKGKFKLKGIGINTIGLKNLCKINKVIHYMKKPSRW